MSTNYFTLNHTSTTGAAIRVFEAATGKVFDFADDTFKLFAGTPTTPYLAMTEAEAANLGTGRSLYKVGLDLARLYRGPLSKQFIVEKYSGASPASTVNPIGADLITVQAGELNSAERRVMARASCTSINGYCVQLAARFMRDGRPVNLLTCGRAQLTANAGTDVITSLAHGLTDGDAIVFHTITGVLPTGITAGTVYYVRDSATDTFKIATTAGGSAIDITGAGTAPNYWDKPSCTFTVRELGSNVNAFTKTLTAAAIINNRFEGSYPNGAAFTANNSTDVLTSNSHGLSNGNQIAVQTGPGGTLPSGLDASTTYFVIGATTNTFQVSLTLAGSAFNFTTNGTGVLNWVPATVLLPDDRQFELGVSMTLAGETIADTSEELTIG